MTEQAFSRKCGNCRRRAVALTTIPYTVQIDHDGRKHTVTILALEAPNCGNCGAIALHEEANKKISEAFRQQTHLLTPEAIREGREKLGLNQQAFADRLGISVSTLSRWETGAQIQQRSLNRLMKAFFRSALVRKHFSRIQAEEGADAPPAPAQNQGADTSIAV
jgi:putative zinc finger/helix-turn-helix YgiT family protein